MHAFKALKTKVRSQERQSDEVQDVQLGNRPEQRMQVELIRVEFRWQLVHVEADPEHVRQELSHGKALTVPFVV